MKSTQTIDEYIASYPADVQEKLQKVRATIRQELPEATERISYGIPTFWQGRNVVHFGGYPNHIGFYPGAQAIVDFAQDLTDYETSKGTVRFPLDKPIPYDLIARITAWRAMQTK